MTGRTSKTRIKRNWKIEKIKHLNHSFLSIETYNYRHFKNGAVHGTFEPSSFLNYIRFALKWWPRSINGIQFWKFLIDSWRLCLNLIHEDKVLSKICNSTLNRGIFKVLMDVLRHPHVKWLNTFMYLNNL